METSRRALMGSTTLVVAGLVGLAALVVVLVVLLGGDDDPEPETADPDPVEEPEPEPEPEPDPPEPVAGDTELLGVRDLSASGTRLAAPGSDADAPVEIDDGDVETLVEDLTAWVDEHLTQLQDGDDGLVEEGGLSDPEGAAALTGPADPVASASYGMIVGARGEPEWAEVTVEVTREDDSTRRARLVFDPDRELVAVEGL